MQVFGVFLVGVGVKAFGFFGVAAEQGQVGVVGVGFVDAASGIMRRIRGRCLGVAGMARQAMARGQRRVADRVGDERRGFTAKCSSVLECGLRGQSNLSRRRQAGRHARRRTMSRGG